MLTWVALKATEDLRWVPCLVYKGSESAELHAKLTRSIVRDLMKSMETSEEASILYTDTMMIWEFL